MIFIKRDRNPSATKIALAYAIQNTAIGAEMIELLTGLDIPAPSKSTDTRYNSCVMFSRKTPSQNASQAFSLAVETITDRENILPCAVQIKLCWTVAWLRGKGMEVDCPVGHTECTANLSPAAPEYEMGNVISTQLGMQDVLVRYVNTDGDA